MRSKEEIVNEINLLMRVESNIAQEKLTQPLTIMQYLNLYESEICRKTLEWVLGCRESRT